MTMRCYQYVQLIVIKHNIYPLKTYIHAYLHKIIARKYCATNRQYKMASENLLIQILLYMTQNYYLQYNVDIKLSCCFSNFICR